MCEMFRGFKKGKGGMIYKKKKKNLGGTIGSPHPLLSPSQSSHSPSLGWPYLVMLLQLQQQQQEERGKETENGERMDRLFLFLPPPPLSTLSE